MTHRPIDTISAACLALIAAAWFGMNTLVVTFGRFAQPTRFYEMGAVLRHPALLFSGVNGAHSMETVSFSVLCLLALAAALTPYFSQRPGTWLAGLLPLALMLICGALLYSGGPAWQLGAVDDSSSAWRADLLRLANDAMQRAEGGIATHVGVGAGGYLSLLASAVLAVRSGVRFAGERARSPQPARG